MLRLDEAIAVVAKKLTEEFVAIYLGGGIDMRIYIDLGRHDAQILALIYEAPTQVDSIAKEIDHDIRARWLFVLRKMSSGS